MPKSDSSAKPPWPSTTCGIRASSSRPATTSNLLPCSELPVLTVHGRRVPHPPRRGLSGRVGLSLLTACFAQVSAVCQITVRADAGFFSRKVVEVIEARQGKLVIIAQLTRPPPKATEAYFHLLFLPATR